MANAVAVKKRAEGANRLPSPDPPPVPSAPTTPTIAADEAEGIDLELACQTCGLVTVWHVGDPFPSCPRCDDATRGEV